MPATPLPRDPVAAELTKARWLLAHLDDFGTSAHFELPTEGHARRWSVSMCRIHGIAPADPVPDPQAYCARVVAPEDREAVTRAFDATVHHPGAEAELQYAIVRPDGARRRLRALLQSFALDHGAVVVMGVVEDLTHRELHQAEPIAATGRLATLTRFAVVGEMAAGLAHEMNQPLTALTNYSTVASRLAADLAGHARLRQAVDGIAAETTRAAEIVGRIRSFVRAPIGAVVAVDLDALVRDTVPLAEALARRNCVALSVRTHGSLPPIHADPVAVQLALLNLVCNAIEASAASGRRDLAVEISTGVVERGVEVAIVDRGIGFDPSLGRQLFMPLYTTKADAPGLGLAIARTLVTQHAGSIELANNPDGGVTARVSIPAADGDPGKDPDLEA